MFKIYSLLLTLIFSFAWPAFLSAGNDDNQFTVVEEGSKKGLLNVNGKKVIPVIYDDLGWSLQEPSVYFKTLGYRENSLWGLINVRNDKITAPLYSSLQPFHDKLIIASRKEKYKTWYGLISTKGEEELAFRYYSLRKNNELLIAAILEKNTPLYGLINDKGQALIGFEYLHIAPLSSETYVVYNQQRQAALYNAEGEALTSFQYDSIAPFQEQLAVVFKDGKQGVIQENGTVVVPLAYKKVKINSAQQVSVLPFGKWHALSAENQSIRTYTFERMIPAGINLYQIQIGSMKTFVDAKGQAILPERWHVRALIDELAIISHNGKQGVLSNSADTNQVILQPEYDSLMVDGAYILACKKTAGGEQAWSLFNDQGEKLTYYAYQDIKQSSEGFFLVKRKNYWGYVNQQGEEVISCQYLTAEPFKQQRATVTYIDGQGVIDTQGRWIIKPFKYNGAAMHLERIHDDLYIFHTEAHQYQSAKYGLVNHQGQELYVTDNQLLDNGYSVWEKNTQGRYGLISYKGKRMLETQYDTISALQEETSYIFAKEGKSGILNQNGKMLVDLKNPFQELHPMSEQYFGVKIDQKYGFVDTLGRLRIANRYDSITHFNSGMAAVSLLGRWGYINKSERLVVQPQFERAYPFSGGLAVVKKDGKYGMVDKRGQTVVPIEYSRIYPGKDNRFLVTRETGKGEQVGLVSRTGSSLIYPKYDSLHDLGNGYVVITRQDKYGLLTVEGRSTIPLIYDELIHDPFNKLYLALESKGWQTINLPAAPGR